MGIFSRLFKVGQAEAHAIVDKLEDPIKITEQGIRDLKMDLQNAMTGLAEVKGVSIRLTKEAQGMPRTSSLVNPLETYKRQRRAFRSRRLTPARRCTSLLMG
jgi:hypothetical protein